jgi:carbonic anhydrase
MTDTRDESRPHSPEKNTPEKSRRELLQLAALGAGASLLSVVPAEDARAGRTDALVLSCMDYRLMDDVETFMGKRGMRNKYDHIVLAGASLGAVQERYPAWSKTFWEHLDIVLKLHHVHTVVIIDHRDCGAYKVILGEDLAKNRDRETEVHAEHLIRLGGAIKQRHPKLDVELHLMALDGSVQSIG